MKLQINYDYNTIDDELINSLLYFLPDKKNEIKIVLNKLKYGDLFLVNENIIEKQYSPDLNIKCLKSKDFIYAVRLLKQCDDDTVILELENDIDYDLIKTITSELILNLIFSDRTELKYIKIGETIYEIYDNVYTALFKRFKVYNIRTYIRTKKIQKII